MGQYTDNGGAKRLFVEGISFYTPRILHVFALEVVIGSFDGGVLITEKVQEDKAKNEKNDTFVLPLR
ncbi:hypothetical protein [Myroides profundi]|uniref:hypothetical protein n=1 Tax=Myroides profundi TaxID=480520 RepID=UPI0005A36B60|nr:hypothetical protein [Myroides profundi]AJH16293.1 hypothetical protein MPR_3167 [Myroides profundi]